MAVTLCGCPGAICPKEGGMQVLAGLAPSSQTVRFLFRFILEQAQGSSWMTEEKISCMVLDRSLVCQQDRWGEEEACMMEANIALVWLGRHLPVSLKRLKNMESSCFKDSENETTLSRLLVSKYFYHLSPNLHTERERERERLNKIAFSLLTSWCWICGQVWDWKISEIMIRCSQPR